MKPTFTRLDSSARHTREQGENTINQVDFYLRFAKAPAKVENIDLEIETAFEALNAVTSVNVKINDRWAKVSKKMKTRFAKLISRRDNDNFKKVR